MPYTTSPRASSRDANVAPMKPAAPVTRTLISDAYYYRSPLPLGAQRHAARAQHELGRSPPLRIAVGIPDQRAGGIAEQRARDGVGEPVLAVGDAPEIGQQRRAVEPRHLVLLRERRHRRPHERYALGGKRLVVELALERLEVAAVLRDGRAQAAEGVLGTHRHRRPDRAALHCAVARVRGALVAGEGEQPGAGERGERQRVAEVRRGLDVAVLPVSLRPPVHAAIGGEREQGRAHSEADRAPSALVAER